MHVCLIVIQFSKKTGDYASLSKTDLRVLALTWDCERRLNGGSTAHLRIAPFPIYTQVGSDKRNKNIQADPLIANTTVDTESAEIISKLELVDLEGTVKDSAVDTDGPSPIGSAAADDSADTDKQSSINEDDDEDGWITPTNLHKHRQRSLQSKAMNAAYLESLESAKVACITADFAMQNVLLQMGMHVCSVDGIMITQLKSWVLRCHACFKITKEMAKKFCPSCGNATLIRTSTSIDPVTGETRYYLKKNFQYNLRGTRYALPVPKGGREGDLILREDQKEFQRAVRQKEREERRAVQDVFDADYVAPMFGEGGSGKGRRGSRQQPTRSPLTIGYGRRNPNEARRKV
jgi:RNA-binding protein NOB1